MITLTDRAKEHLNEVLTQEAVIEQNPDFVLGIRLAVQGGGCSGFQYSFTMTEVTEEDDQVIPLDCKFFFVVDPISMQYLEGAVIDYKDDLMGSSFSINNPNVKSTCGCGASFQAYE